MIIIARPDVSRRELDSIREQAEAVGLTTHVSRCDTRTTIGCVGPEAARFHVEGIDAVLSSRPAETDYVLASRAFRAHTTHVALGAHVLGGTSVPVIAGPCSVEGRQGLLTVAESVRDSGAAALRGGAFKPRTSPYDFQGLGEEALHMLAEARRRTRLPVVTEVTDPRQVEAVAACVDVFQIGARNMQNYDLLQEVGRTARPVLLKRGASATVRELILAAEYVLKQGNPDVVLCERGIRTFETATRNTLDLGGLAVLQRETHLPVIVDPSHAAGDRALVAPLAMAAVAAGADGLLIEVHQDPDRALSDGAQSLTLDGFAALMPLLDATARVIGRRVLPEAEGPAQVSKTGGAA